MSVPIVVLGNPANPDCGIAAAPPASGGSPRLLGKPGYRDNLPKRPERDSYCQRRPGRRQKKRLWPLLNEQLVPA